MLVEKISEYEFEFLMFNMDKIGYCYEVCYIVCLIDNGVNSFFNVF